MTEVWYRNPHNYIRELSEVGATQVAWDRGLLVKKRINPFAHAKLYFANTPDWRVLLIGLQGTAELRIDHDIDAPYAVYPTWSAETESLELLEEMMQFPIGDDSEACNDPNLAADERPVSGQEHRVVVTDMPNASTGPGRAMARKLKELQEDYPDCILHVHGLYGWRVSFGMGFRATDVDPRTNAGKGKVQLPNGREMFAERTINCQQWVTLLGMSTAELMREPRNRCIYNIKSALWAGENYLENIAFKSGGSPVAVDPNAVTHTPATTVSGSHLSRPNLPVQPNDKIQCDTCSLQNSCKYYRQGSVCSVPGSEPASLANHFKTRDADQIIDGLGTLLAFQSRRLEKGAREEEEYGELDPEVTKIANSLFTNGVKLAKLVNPTLNGPGVQVNIGGNAAAVQASTPNQVLGSIVRELESRGISRSDITPGMVGNLLAEMNGAGKAPEAIQGQVLSRES